MTCPDGCRCAACVDRRAWEQPEKHMSQEEIERWAQATVAAMRPSGRRLVRHLDDRPGTL